MKEMLSNIFLIALGRSVLKGQYYFFKKIFVTLLLIIQPPMSNVVLLRKNLTTENKPSTSCVRTACYKLSTCLEQFVNKLIDIIRLVIRVVLTCPIQS